MGASLIIAIGVQNAFVLRQGIKQRHVLLSVLTPTVVDVVLIGAGVLGFGALVERYPGLITFVTWGGALFLTAYALKSFYSALKPETLSQDKAKGLLKEDSAKATFFLILSFSLLNPHVYLDTVVLLGGLSSVYEGFGKYIFGIGAMMASVVWFFALGYGARFLAPLFEKPKAWQILDILIGFVMLFIAAKLIL